MAHIIIEIFPKYPSSVKKIVKIRTFETHPAWPFPVSGRAKIMVSANGPSS
jgi:hypothetical protein